ncbi:MAG: NAD(P)/FAD-dependent oxidoreductase [Lautropia sp.]
MADWAAAGPAVAVVGAGAVGVCVALALRRRGATVTLIDRDGPGAGCSRGNSGAISPNSVVPLATPGVLASLATMAFDHERPLRVPLRYLPRAAPWLARFVCAAAPHRRAESIRCLAALHDGAVSKHRALALAAGVPELFVQRGHLHLYPDDRAYRQDAPGWAIRARHGHPHERLGRDQILALEPNVGPRYQVGAFLADQATIRNPLRYVQAIARLFAAHGGQSWQADVDALRPLAGGRWQVTAAGAAHTFDHAVVAAGAWSRRLLDPLGIRLRLESQRGYHVQFPHHAGLVSRTIVLTDRKVFVTPMEEGLRVGGTVEIAGLDAAPDWRRAALLERVARQAFSGLDEAASSRWAGHRPCLPDSVPVVGPAPGHRGLWLAVGHGHLGLTDSPATGERLAQAIAGGLPIEPRPATDQAGEEPARDVGRLRCDAH